MSVYRLSHWVSLAYAASIIGMMAGTARGSGPLVVGWASMFLVVMGGVAMLVNRSHAWREHGSQALRLSAVDNARLAAITYAWCGTALQAVYITPITGIRWQHSWQYGLGLALVAVGTFAYGSIVSRQPADGKPNGAVAAAPLLAFVQALLAAGCIVFLILSGKLVSRRMDWASNQVFLFGALTILVLSLTALVSLRRIEQS
jgi:hypothetical protein